jgi:hypothetical protein
MRLKSTGRLIKVPISRSRPARKTPGQLSYIGAAQEPMTTGRPYDGRNACTAVTIAKVVAAMT